MRTASMQIMRTIHAWIWPVALVGLTVGALQAAQGQTTVASPKSPTAAGTADPQKTDAEPEHSGDGSAWVFRMPGSMVGNKLPSFEVAGKNDATFSSDSLRGAPALIEFWATWCAPCVASLPELASFFHETKCEGLVLVTLDQDNIAGKANDFLAKRHYDWPDYHESDEVRQLLGNYALPRTILVDPGGTIVYDDARFQPDELRAELGKMRPQIENPTSDQSTCQTPNKNTGRAGH